MSVTIRCPCGALFKISKLDEHDGAWCDKCESHVSFSVAERLRLKARLAQEPELPFGACPDCGGNHHESEHLAPPKLCEACEEPMPVGTRDTRRFHVGCCPSRKVAERTPMGAL